MPCGDALVMSHLVARPVAVSACGRHMDSTVAAATRETVVQVTGADTAGPRWSRHLREDVPPTEVLRLSRSSRRHRRVSDLPAARYREMTRRCNGIDFQGGQRLGSAEADLCNL